MNPKLRIRLSDGAKRYKKRAPDNARKLRYRVPSGGIEIDLSIT